MFFQFFTLSFVSTANAATIYVDGNSGRDGNTGSSISNAVQTISRGAQLLRSGDTMIIRPGTYYEFPTFNNIANATIKAETRGTVTISGMWKEAALGQVSGE